LIYKYLKYYRSTSTEWILIHQMLVFEGEGFDLEYFRNDTSLSLTLYEIRCKEERIREFQNKRVSNKLLYYPLISLVILLSSSVVGFCEFG